MSGTVRVDEGGEGELVRLSGEVLYTVLDRAFAPGRPLRLRVTLLGVEEVLPVQGKVIGSKKRDDGRFDVRLRLINLRREHREQLEARAAR